MYYGMHPGFVSRYNYTNTHNSPCHYQITVNGRGKFSAAPDKAGVILGVVTEGASLKAIQQENASKMSRIIADLKRMGIGENEIGTHSYFINMVYDHVDSKQVFKGYRVTNTIKADTRDIQRVGEIIDTAVSSGANLVENIDFSLSDQSMYYRKALSLAVKDSIENAKAVVKTLDAEIDEVPVCVTEEAPYQVPMAVKSTFAAYEADTPIKPGLIDITAYIKAVFNYRKYKYL